MPDNWIPDEEWRIIVENVPLVSVDLVVRVDGGVLLGKRENDPARGEWFVPGGTVKKNERLVDAVHRIAREELGVDVDVERRLGAYEHLYDTSDVDGVDSKHYLANGFVVRPQSEEFTPDDQHADLRVFSPPFADLHPYVEAYLADAGLTE